MDTPNIAQEFLEIEDDLVSKLNDLKFEPKAKYVFNIPEEFLRIENELVLKLDGLNFEAEYVFNPLEYAAEPHKEYVTKYCNGTKKVLFLDMNPGPWGMAQTGIPFGDVKSICDWLNISNTTVTKRNVDKYGRKVTKFAVTGFDCKESDQSGAWFWSLMKEKFREPGVFFHNNFVYNYCPLLFLNKDGGNLPAEELTDSDKKKLEEYCDKSLSKIIELLKIETVVAIGDYAKERADKVKNAAELQNVEVIYMPHPSPKAGTGDPWKDTAWDIIQNIPSIRIPEEFLRIEKKLMSKLDGLNFEAEYVFNPLEYALEPHEEYVRKYCNGTKKVLFLGMNPSKWGMAQTGVPFADIKWIRDLLKISNTNVNTDNIEKNQKVTKFAMTGFNLVESEDSGTWFWSLFPEKFREPGVFFHNCFVYNYCPLLFLDKAEDTLPAQKLTDSDKKKLEKYCDKSLSKIIELLKIETVVAIGDYAKERADEMENVEVVFMPHPSLCLGEEVDWRDEAWDAIQNIPFNRIPNEFIEIKNDLVSKLNVLEKKIEAEYVFNPLKYAKVPHEEYVTNYCNGTKKVLFLGMNPGKWGMAQTGIPFGDVKMVRDWLKISNTNVIKGQVDENGNEVTKFAVTGFDCKKSELSGTRFWSLIEEKCKTPEAFFNNCFVYNYCPFLFLYENGNILPVEKLTYGGSDKRQLEQHCDNALEKIIKLLKIETVVGIGRYAEERANAVKKAAQLENVTVVCLKHPSPWTKAGADKWKEEARNTTREHLPWLMPAENL